MKKINLKNILKKTFKKKKKKKKKVSKKFKTSKVKKIKKLKSKTPSKNEKITKEDNKADSLRIPKTNELKPEIKKIKKQETEKKVYKIKEYVVYPKHGVGQITEFKKISIGGIEVETYFLKFEKDNLKR